MEHHQFEMSVSGDSKLTLNTALCLYMQEDTACWEHQRFLLSHAGSAASARDVDELTVQKDAGNSILTGKQESFRLRLEAG